METLNSHVDIDRVYTRLLYLGLIMNVLFPMILLALGTFLKSNGLSSNVGFNLKGFFLVMIVIAIGEIPVIYLVKRSSLASRKACQERQGRLKAENTLFQWGILIYFLSLSPTIYGLIYYLLGGTFEHFVLFIAITLLCFMLFKPKEKEIHSFVEKLLNM